MERAGLMHGAVVELELSARDAVVPEAGVVADLLLDQRVDVLQRLPHRVGERAVGESGDVAAGVTGVVPLDRSEVLRLTGGGVDVDHAEARLRGAGDVRGGRVDLVDRKVDRDSAGGRKRGRSCRSGSALRRGDVRIECVSHDCLPSCTCRRLRLRASEWDSCQAAPCPWRVTRAREIDPKQNLPRSGNGMLHPLAHIIAQTRRRLQRGKSENRRGPRRFRFTARFRRFSAHREPLRSPCP